jgi:hypothetical protein
MINRRTLLGGLAVAGFVASLSPVAASAQDISALKGRTGIYTGKWEGKLESTLTIRAILDDGTVQGTYAWGDMRDWNVTKGSANFAKPKVDQANTFKFGAQIAPGTTVRQEFTFNADGTISGKRFVNDKHDGSIVFKKTAELASVSR